MSLFQSILVGIDLSYGDRFVSPWLKPPNEAALKQALWLAKQSGGTLTFSYALDLSPAARKHIDACERVEQTVVDQAREALSKLVTEANSQGVAADQQVLIGRSWVELIRLVKQNNHDLVVAGTKHVSRWAAM